MKTDTHAKGHNDGSINATTHQYHLSEVSTGGFYVVDSYGDEREAGGIEEDVDDRPQIIVHSTEPKKSSAAHIVSPVLSGQQQSSIENAHTACSPILHADERVLR